MKNLLLILTSLVAITAIAQENWVNLVTPTQVNEILETNNNFYLATWGGLIVLDKNSDQVTRLLKTDGLPSNKIEDVIEDANGNIWIGTYDNGIAMLNNGQWTQTIIPEDLSPNQTRLYCVEVDANGTPWIGTNTGIYSYSNSTWVLKSNWDCWDMISENNKIYAAGNVPMIIESDSVINLGADSIFAYGNGAVSAKSTGEIYYALDNHYIIELDGSNIRSWESIDGDFTISEPFTDLLITEADEIYVLAAPDDLYKLENDVWVGQNLVLEYSDQAKKITEADDGSILIGGNNELIKLNNGIETRSSISLKGMRFNAVENLIPQFYSMLTEHPDAISSQEINGFITNPILNPDGNLFLNEWRVVYNQHTQEVSYFDIANGIQIINGTSRVFNPGGFGISQFTRNIMIDANGNIWITTSQAIHQFDLAGNHLTFTDANSPFTVPSFWEIGEDAYDNIWISGSYDLCKWDGTSWSESYNALDYNWAIGGAGQGFSFGQDNLMYTYSWNSGLTTFDGTTFTNYDTNNSDLVNNNVYDSEWYDGKLYLATNGGLSVFDNGSFTNFNQENSKIHDDQLRSLATDLNGNLWMGGPWGMSVYNKNGVVNSVISSDEPSTISLFPNPSDDFIQVSSETEFDSYLIYSSSGRLIENTTLKALSKNTVVSVEHLNPGVYYILIESDKIWSGQSFIVK